MSTQPPDAVTLLDGWTAEKVWSDFQQYEIIQFRQSDPAKKWLETSIHGDAAEAVFATLADRARLERENEELKRRVADLEPFEPPLVGIEDGEIRIDIARQTMQVLAEAFQELNGSANYTETTFSPALGNGPDIIVTVQSSDRPTSHQLRRKAEAENEELRAEVERLKLLVLKQSR